MKPPIEDLAKARFLIDQISDDFKHLVMLYDQDEEDHRRRLALARRGINQLTILVVELQRRIDAAT